MSQEMHTEEAALLLTHLSTGHHQRAELSELVTQLAEAAERRAQKSRFVQLAAALREGTPVGEALSHWPGLRQLSLKAWVDHADGAGMLAQVLGFLSGDVRLRGRRMHRTKAAFIWPGLLFAAATAVAVIASVFVFPAYREAFEDLGLMHSPGSLKYFGAWDGGFGLLSFGVVLPMASAVTVFWLATARSAWPDRLYHRLRLDKDLWERETQLRLLPLLTEAVGEGKMAGHALSYLAETTPVYRVQSQLQLASKMVSNGDSLDRSVLAAGLMPPIVMAHLSVGKRTHNLAHVADLLAAQMHEQWVLASMRFERRITVLVYVLVALIVMQLLYSVYLPIFQLGQSI